MKIFRRKSQAVGKTPPPKSVTKALLEDDTHAIFAMYEHERRRTDLGWSYRNLEAGDPKRYGTASGDWQSETFQDPMQLLPEGWYFQGKWQVDKNVAGADGDWMYAYDFRVLQKLDETGAGGEGGGGAQSEQFVRRKRWERQIVKGDSGNGSGIFLEDEEEGGFLRDDVSMISDMDAGGGVGSPGTPTSSTSSSSQMRYVGGEDKDGAGAGAGGGKYEYSDDEDEDEERQRSFTNSNRSRSYSTASYSSSTPVKGGGGGSSSSNKYNTVIRAPELSAIGKQMKALEVSCRKQDEAKSVEWKNSIAPGYKAQVKELEKRIDTLKKRLVVEAGMGIGAEHLSVIEEELKTHTQVYESFKRQLYFPTSTVALGENGVYFALDDFFLEHASGQFILDLVPGRQHPQVILLLTGTAVGDESGVSIRLKIGKFKLKGDKGKGVPSLSFDTIKITTVLRVTAMLSFDMDRKKWVCGSENFAIDMLYFRGPFGIRQSLVKSVLTLTTPLIRGAILDALPPELGVFVAHLPSPLSVRGEFTISGTELNNFTAKMHKSPEMCALVGYSPSQMLVFMSIQKSIDRSSGDLIKTMEDLLNYRKIGTTYHREWDEIRSLWNEAIEIYFSKANITDFPPLSFEQLLMGTDEILRNPLSIQFALHSCECQVSLRSVLENVIDFFVRWRTSNDGKDEMVHIIRKLKDSLILLGSLLGLVSQNLDFADLKVALKLMAGPKGLLHINCKDIIAQVPLAMVMPLPSEIGLGFAAPVPHIFFIRSQADGVIAIEMLHLGSHEMKSRTAYGDWKVRTEQHNAMVLNGRGGQDSARSGDKQRNADNEALTVDDIKSTRFLSSHPDTTSPSPLPSSLSKAFGSVEVEDNNANDNEEDTKNSTVSSDPDSSNSATNTNIIEKPKSKKRMSVFSSFKKSSKSSDGDTSTSAPAVKKRSSVSKLIPSALKKKSTTSTTESTGTTDSSPDTEDRLSSLSVTALPVTASGVVKPKRRFSTSAGRALQLSRQPTARGLDSTNTNTTDPTNTTSIAPSSTADSVSETSSVTSNVTKENNNVQDNYFQQATDHNRESDPDHEEREEGFITASERERRSLAKTLKNRPPVDGLHRLLLIKVLSPHISVIVDQTLKLKPGAELLNVKLGPVSKDWVPFGFESSTPLHASRDTPAEQKKQTLVNTNPATARFLSHGDHSTDAKNEGDDRYGAYAKEEKTQTPVQASVLGCPMLLQTSDHIKALAQIPNVEIDVHMATVLRFIDNFFDDIDVLRRFLGVMDAHLQDEIDEYIFLFKVLMDRLGKYFLLPNLELEVNISAKIVATDEDIILTIQPNVPLSAASNGGAGGLGEPRSALSAMGNSASDFSSSSGGDNVIQLFAKINVMDVVADYLAVANAMTRCAQFYEQNHGDEGSDNDDNRSEA